MYVYNLPHCADYITSDTLQCLDVPIVDSVECENSYPGMISPRMVCAGFMDGGKDTCNVSTQQCDGPGVLLMTFLALLRGFVVGTIVVDISY